MSLIKFNNSAAHQHTHTPQYKKTFLIKWREKLEKFFIMEFRYVALIDFICLASHIDLKCAVEFHSDSFVLHVILLFDFSLYIPKYLTSHTILSHKYLLASSCYLLNILFFSDKPNICSLFYMNTWYIFPHQSVTRRDLKEIFLVCKITSTIFLLNFSKIYKFF